MENYSGQPPHPKFDETLQMPTAQLPDSPDFNPYPNRMVPPIRAEDGAQPASYSTAETKVDKGLRRTAFGLGGSVVILGLSAVVLGVGLYLDQKRDDPFVPLPGGDKRTEAQETASASPTISLSPSSTPSHSHSLAPSPKVTKVKSEVSESPSRTVSASASASPSTSASPSASESPEASTSPSAIYPACEAGPQVVVCQPAASKAAEWAYDYPDPEKGKQVWHLEDGQEIQTECKLVMNGAGWVLTMAGNYAMADRFGGYGSLSGVPDCDMN